MERVDRMSPVKQDQHPDYEDRVVLYLDILGWKGLINASKKRRAILDTLLDKLDCAKRAAEALENQRRAGKQIPCDPQVTYFSDSIVVSCLDSQVGKERVLLWAIRLCIEFLPVDFELPSGLLCRGGIAKGLLYHRGNTVLGPALNAAYYMESKVATYPRILVSYPIRAQIAGLQTDYPITFRRDPSDGRFHLDTLSAEVDCPDSNVGKPSHARIWLDKYRQSICDGLKQCGNDPKKREKWLWLTDYFHDVIRAHPDIGVEPVDVVKAIEVNATT